MSLTILGGGSARGGAASAGAGQDRGRGAVVVSWDDGWQEQAQLADLADARGQSHTFYVNGGLLDTADRLSTAQLVDMQRRGHEIAWHGATHQRMPDLSVAARAAEWDGSALEAALGRPLRAFAYPFGSSSTVTHTETHLRYGSVAVLTAGFAGASVYDMNGPMPHVHYRHDWGAGGGTHETALELVRLAAAQPVAVHVYAHRPDQAANPTMAQVLELLDLCQELGVPVVPVSAVFGAGPRLVNGGYEAGLAGWLAAPGGAGTGQVVEDAPMPGLTGTRSLLCTLPTSADFFYARQYVPAVPGRSYTLAARVRCADGGSGVVRVGGRSVDAQVAAPQQSAAYTGTDWGRVQQVWTCPATVRWAQVDVLAIGAAGRVWFDHVDWSETALGNYA